MATMNSNQENLYQEVLKVLQAAQKFYGDPEGVKETAERLSTKY